MSKEELIVKVENLSKDYSELREESMDLHYFVSRTANNLKALIMYGELTEPLSFKMVNNEEFEKRFNVKL